MKYLSACRNCLRCSCSKIHLVDRCLIIFMLILVVQSAFTLLTNSGAPASNDIDVIVRTSAAAIFGYFMSANFIRHTPAARTGSAPNSAPTELHVGRSPGPGTPQNQIGFSISEDKNELTSGGVSVVQDAQQSEESAEGRLQVIVVTAVGLICLITLIIVRNVPAWNQAVLSDPSASATVAQFRDFISGCVGFLIGCPTERKLEPDVDL